MPRQVTITQKQDRLVYSMSCQDIPHFAPEDAPRAPEEAEVPEEKTIVQQQDKRTVTCLGVPGFASEEAGRDQRVAEDARAGGHYPTMRQTLPLHTCLLVPGLDLASEREEGKSSRGSRA
jgi:hypothetical protein